MSKAVVLSQTNTSIREISQKLNLSERTISKCQVNPALNLPHTLNSYHNLSTLN